jgi:hypothetical protein
MQVQILITPEGAHPNEVRVSDNALRKLTSIQTKPINTNREA